MSKPTPVVKHSFTRGPRSLSRSRAHVNYLVYRAGEDREEREFFDHERDGLDRKEVNETLEQNANDRGDLLVHRFVISPGVHGLDMKDYAREMMAELGRAKGQELNWRGIVHSNTDHTHAHVIVLGRDADGKLVRFSVKDYRQMREVGREICERDYRYELYLEPSISREFERETKPDRGDEIFNLLMFGADPREEKERKNSRQDLEDRNLHDEMHKQSRDGEIKRSVRGRQRRYEQAGKLSDFHEQYVNSTLGDRLEQKNAAPENNGAPEVADTGDILKQREVDSLHRLFGMEEPAKDRQRDDMRQRSSTRSDGQTQSAGERQVSNDTLRQSVNQSQRKRNRGDDENGGE